MLATVSWGRNGPQCSFWTKSGLQTVSGESPIGVRPEAAPVLWQILRPSKSPSLWWGGGQALCLTLLPSCAPTGAAAGSAFGSKYAALRTRLGLESGHEGARPLFPTASQHTHLLLRLSPRVS